MRQIQRVLRTFLYTIRRDFLILNVQKQQRRRNSMEKLYHSGYLSHAQQAYTLRRVTV